MRRRFYFVIQSRLQRGPDGRIRTIRGYARYEAWGGYLRSFDEVVLLARVEPSEDMSGASVEGPGVTVLEVPYYRGFRELLKATPALVRFMRTQIVDRTACYGARVPNPVGLLLQARARQLNAPFLVQVVGNTAESLQAGTFGNIGRLAAPLARAVVRHSVRSAQAAIFVTRRTLQEIYPPSADAIVLSRSNVELPAEAVAQAPRDYASDPLHDPVRIVTAGSQEQNYKGHDVLLESVKLLNEQGVQVQVTIVGGGRLHDELVQKANNLGLRYQVHFTGNVPGSADVRDYIRQSDLFILPSRTEGLPRALIEAMACGVVSMGSAVGGVPELLSSDFIFEPSDPEALAATVVSTIQKGAELSGPAREQWATAKEIASNFSGDEVLANFLNEWRRRPS